MLNDDIEKAYEVAYEMFFTRDFSDIETLKSLVNILISDKEASIGADPQSVIMTRANAQKSASGGLYEYTGGLTFYDFLKEVSAELDENPETVVNHINEVVNIVKNKYNATSLFVGNDESIAKYNEAAKQFFAKLPSNDFGTTERDFYVPDGNEAVVIDSNVNYNLLTASLDEANTEYNGDIGVTGSLISNKFLVPYLRYNKGAYGAYQIYNKHLLSLASYRDPQLTSTYDYYNNVGDLLRNADITQDELNGYIVSYFVGNINFDNDFENTYNYITTKVYNSDDNELYYKQLNDYLDTTPDKVNADSDVYDDLAQNGTKHTIGNENDIIENADLFDTITIPSSDGEIYIYVNGEKVDSDTAPVIKDSRVYVPIGVISEALGSDVEWDAEEKVVTVSSEDKTLSLSIGSNEMLTNGEATTIDAAPEIMNGRTMVPLRAISEAFEKNVDWKTGCVIIK
jgi:Zn-dependent M16 (insulinase) family peptidase